MNRKRRNEHNENIRDKTKVSRIPWTLKSKRKIIEWSEQGFSLKEMEKMIQKDLKNDSIVLASSCVSRWKKAKAEIFTDSHRAKHSRDKRNDGDLDKEFGIAVMKLHDQWAKKLILALVKFTEHVLKQ